MNEEITCDSCGRSMTHNDQSFIGFRFDVQLAPSSSPTPEATMHVIHPSSDAFTAIYPELIEDGASRRFNVCYVCWLRSMGVKV